MGKNRTEKSKYPSLYSDGWVTSNQYILELICEKKARKENKDLPKYFWRLKEWEKFFVMQTRKCSQLLKKYDERAIIAALKNKKTWNVHSLHAPWLPRIIEEEQKVIIAKDKLAEESKKNKSVGNKMSTGKGIKIKKNVLSKLKELDG